MSSEIETGTQIEITAQAPAETTEKPKPEVKKKEKSPLDQFLQLLSSVKFGISMLVILMLFSAIGTFVVQQGTSDFPKFLASLTPAEKQIYEGLGFFDIYHTWYFNLLLLTLSLNIILASIDRAPGYWHFFSKPQTVVSENYVKHQQVHNHYKLPVSSYTPEFIQRIARDCRLALQPKWAAIFGPLTGLILRLTSFRMRISEGKDGSTTVFVERGVWNRLAFCGVHVALLMILLGWFVGNKWGQKGVIQFAPGQMGDVFFSPGQDMNSMKTFKLPFNIQCLDIKQDLIDSTKHDLAPQNTLDWHTTVVFEENGQKYKGNVHLNNPVDFRGYRFFQASFDEMNSARNVTLQLVPKDGNGEPVEVALRRNGTAEIPGVGMFKWVDFYPDFRFDPQSKKAFSETGEYNRPAAEVQAALTDGTTKSALGFPQEFYDAMKQSGQQAPFVEEATTIGNYTMVLKYFEKVSRAHTLQVQYDPGVDTVYAGCTLLVVMLIMVFFFNHERVWVLVKPGENELALHIAGNTNRNRPSFDLRYSSIISKLQGEETKEVKAPAKAEKK